MFFFPPASVTEKSDFAQFSLTLLPPRCFPPPRPTLTLPPQPAARFLLSHSKPLTGPPVPFPGKDWRSRSPLPRWPMGSRCPRCPPLSPAAKGSGRRALPERRERRRGWSGVTLTCVSGDTAGARSTGMSYRRPSSSLFLSARDSLVCLCRFSILASNARDFSRCALAGGRGRFRGVVSTATLFLSIF